MARIPEFTRRQFANTASQAQIRAAGAGFAAFGQVAGQVAAGLGQRLQQRRQEQIATESAKFNSGLEIQAQEIFTGLSTSEEIKRDPSQLRSRVAQEFQKLRNAPEFLQQPRAVQQNAISRLQSLESQFQRRSITFEAQQTLQNNIDNLDTTQTNYEELASSSDAPIDDLLLAFTKDIIPFTQAIGDTDKGEEIQKQGSRAIVEQRINRLIEQSNFSEAKQLLSDEAFGDFFTAKQRTKLRDTLQRGEDRIACEREKEMARQTAIQAVTDALQSGTPIDAKDKANQRIMNEFYNDSGINDGLINQDIVAANQLTAIAARTNFIPTQAESTLRAQLTTGSSAQKQYAADVISRLQEEAPRSLDAFQRRDLEQVNLAVNYIRSGVEPGKAFQFANEQTDMTNKPLIDERKAGLNAITKKQDFAAQAEEALDPGFFTIGPDLPDAPIARDSIIADYRNIFEGFMLSTGDVDVAKKLTEQEFTRLYGQSEATGRRLVMKYPPENYYAIPGLDNEWMPKQLQRELQDMMGAEVDLDNVVLIADSITAREAQPGNRPSYQVFIEQELGDFMEVRDAEGNLLRFRFDPTEAIERTRSRLQEQQQEDIGSAKRARERRLINQSVTTPDEAAADTILLFRGLQ